MRHIGAEAVHVPYRGTAAALIDTAAGNVQFTSDNAVTALPLIREGRVRAYCGELGGAHAPAARGAEHGGSRE